MSPRRELHSATAPPSRARRVLGVLGATFLTLLVVASVSLALVTTLGGYHLTRVLSNSMHPAFTVGDFVIVQDRPVSELATGGVVVLPDPNSSALYIHRLTSVVRDGADTLVTTKGDNNPTPDAWTLKVTSPTVPVYVTAIPTHSLNLPILPVATAQMLFALGLAMLSLVLLLPGDGRARRAKSPAHG